MDISTYFDGTTEKLQKIPVFNNPHLIYHIKNYKMQSLPYLERLSAYSAHPHMI